MKVRYSLSRLAKERRRQGLSRQQVAQRLGVKTSDIRNLEEGHNDQLSPDLLRSLSRQYALFLDLNPADYELTRSTGATKPEKRRMVSLGRTGTVTALIIIVSAGIIWLAWQTLSAVAIPRLEVWQPLQGEVIQSPTAQVRGVSSQQAQVYVNDNAVPLDPQGQFDTRVVLSEGPNEIEVIAINSFGRQNRIERIVIYRSALD